ncbi:sterol carrier protein domain-containing protein [Georgenia sp. SUBG003]|uniref:sterol carrier protein domain-containing protein n=1 Tax=Georgenia sp. SUBG003 TaxID=1497974 RepID=UPI003AB12321
MHAPPGRTPVRRAPPGRRPVGQRPPPGGPETPGGRARTPRACGSPSCAPRPASPRGYALFRRKGDWADTGQPQGTVKVRESVALDAAAARALWGTLTDLDLMAGVHTGRLAVDDALLHLLTDLRGAQVRLHDGVWLRLLDVGAALAGRRYAAEVDVVLEVRDELLPANAGRWHLRGSASGATAVRTGEAAHLVLDVADLASAYLGGFSLAALAGAGRVTELAPGSLAAASTAFGSPLAPAISWGF